MTQFNNYGSKSNIRGEERTQGKQQGKKAVKSTVKRPQDRSK